MKTKLISIGLLLIIQVTYAQTCIEIVDNPDAADPAFGLFTKYIEIFGVKLYATSDVPDDKFVHAGAVMAEYLDNDENGYVDNQLVVDAMVQHEAFLLMPNQEDNTLDNFFNAYQGNGIGQDLFGFETHPEGSGSAGFDATLEEVLHLITHAGYAQAYPSIFGETQGTNLTDAMDIARGGQFTAIPNSYPEGAWYTYDDATCDYGCMATEYIYWSHTSILGAQDYPGRCVSIENEWDLCTEALVQSTDPVIYNLLTDPQYGFATILPDGIYCVDTTTAGILEELSSIRMELYPNPVSDYLNVRTNTKGKLDIFDVHGRVEQEISVEVGFNMIEIDLSIGVHYVRLVTIGGTVSDLFILK